MAVAFYTQFALFKELTGLSSDTKPTPVVGETWTFFETDTSKFYTYDGVWTESLNPSYGTAAALALKANIASPTFTGTVSGITATMVGLGNVDNTSDANKPVSTATQTALDGKANSLGPDDNYVTDAQLVVIGNTSGTNTGNQTTIAGITGTIAQFNTALTDGDFATGGGTATGTNTGDQTLPTDATIVTSDIITNDATTAKHGWMPKGSGSTTTFFRSDMTQVAPTVTITQAEIDVGTTPVSEATIAVTDAGITTSSKIIGGLAYIAPTGKDLDELEMDALDILFEPATGSMNVIIKGLEGYIADKFKIWYTFA